MGEHWDLWIRGGTLVDGTGAPASKGEVAIRDGRLAPPGALKGSPERGVDATGWLGGPGFYALVTHQYSLGVQAVLSGETKGLDTQQGQRLDDTGITALYVGPGFGFTWGTSLAADVTVDLPAIQDNTSVQIVPNYRLRGGLTWRF